MKEVYKNQNSSNFTENAMCQHAVRSYDLCCGAIFQASGSCRSPTPPSIHRSTHIHKHMVSSCFLSRSSPNSPAQSTTSAPKPALTRKQNQNFRWPTSLRLPPVCPLSFFVRVPNLYIVLYCSFCLCFYPLQLSLNSHFVLLHTIPLFLSAVEPEPGSRMSGI